MSKTISHLKERLSLKSQQLVLPGPQQDADDLIADPRVDGEELGEGDVEAAVGVAAALHLDYLAQLDDLAGDAVVGLKGPLLAQGALDGGAVLGVARHGRHGCIFWKTMSVSIIVILWHQKYSDELT